MTVHAWWLVMFGFRDLAENENLREKPKFWSKNHGPLLGGRINVEKYQLKGLRLIKHSCVVAVRQDQESVSLVKTEVACQLQKYVGGGGLTGQTELRASKMAAEIQGLETEKVAGETFEKPKDILGCPCWQSTRTTLLGRLSRNRWDSTRNHVE
jgi:hypothetical protein